MSSPLGPHDEDRESDVAMPERAPGSFRESRSRQVDRYRTDEESSVESVSDLNSSATTALLQNTLLAASTAASAARSPTSRSRNSLAAAARLRKSRKEKRRAEAEQQNQGDDDHSIASASTTSTTASPLKGSRNLRDNRGVKGFLQESNNNNYQRHTSATPPKSNGAPPRHSENIPTSALIMPTSPSPTTSPNSTQAALAAARFALRSRTTQRHRVAGGAAAKLMLQGPAAKQTEQEKVEDKYAIEVCYTGEFSETPHAASAELDEMREKTRNEFALGTRENTRYQPSGMPGSTTRDDADDDGGSEASVPSILNRSEVFHDNATAAILALLTPRTPRGGGDGGSVISQMSTISTMDANANTATFSPFQSPVRADSVVSGTSGVEKSFESMPKVRTKPLLNNNAEKRLETMKTKMVDPSKTLADLLTAIASPSEGEPMDRGYMVRRKNACGALKVLTANAANRRTICWTVGVLPSLTAVMDDASELGATMTFRDVHTRREYLEARKRAVAALLNLCSPKENRLPIFHCPGLIQAVARTIADDKEESRQGCCAILAYMAKSPENRLLMVQVPGLVEAITGVIKPRVIRPREKNTKKPTSYVWDTSSGEEESSFSTAGRMEIMTSDDTDRFTTETDTVETETESSMRHDDDSDITPQMTTSPTSVASRAAMSYDKDPNTFIHGARQNVFAVLLHVIKEKDNAFHLARDQNLVTTLIEISKLQESPSHTHAVKVISHLTRHRDNSKLITFQYRIVIPAMVHATYSQCDEARRHALYALENLSQDKPCRQEVANTKDLVTALCQRARHAVDSNEKLAAIGALKNLTDEPANLIPMTNTPECFATLMHLANSQDTNTTELMQYLACDALATLSHWLRKIATNGYALDAAKQGSGLPATTGLITPSFKVITWSQWT